MRAADLIVAAHKPVGLIADPLDQHKWRTFLRQRDTVHEVTQTASPPSSRSLKGYEVGQPKLLERLVNRRQLALRAVDQDQVGKWSPVFQ